MEETKAKIVVGKKTEFSKAEVGDKKNTYNNTQYYEKPFFDSSTYFREFD